MEKGNKKITPAKPIPVEQKTLSQILAWKEEKETIEKLKNETKEFVTNSLQDATTNTKTANKIKTWVSQDKNRFCFDGFDLDLSYITKQIISIGLPSTSIEAFPKQSRRRTEIFKYKTPLALQGI